MNDHRQLNTIPEQWKAMLLKNGAKEAELDWMGWDEFSQDKKSLIKQEVQDWIDQNKIEVEDVIKSSMGTYLGEDFYTQSKIVEDMGFMVDVFVIHQPEFEFFTLIINRYNSHHLRREPQQIPRNEESVGAVRRRKPSEAR